MDRNDTCGRPRAARLASLALFVLAGLGAGLVAGPAGAGAPRVHEDVGFELFESPQADPILLSADGSLLFVADTVAHSVEVFDTALRLPVASVPVGVEPVALALRPGGGELWVANHVSDSVSVVDVDPASPTRWTVIETIQDLDPTTGATRFDEPVGIAFASASKAYVALSSRNRIAIVDAASYAVTGSLAITAQDPRAIAVRDGRLYVLAFESGNRSEVSICASADGTSQCTLGFGAVLQAGSNPNLPGLPKNIVVDPDVPDRDLFVFDTATDQLRQAVQGVGTLLYGLAVDGAGRVFVTNTDARNHDQDGNGLAAPPPLGQGRTLADLQNRAFRNRVTRIDCGGASCGAPIRVDLEPAPGSPVPVPLATPYGVATSADGAVVLVTASGSDRLAALDGATLAVEHTLAVGANPRGVAFASNGAGGTAYVLNTLGDTVTIVSVAASGALAFDATLAVGLSDPTPAGVRAGRILFHAARASASGTFSCASCHPDAHVDQLLWFIGARCTVAGCDQEEQRSTMPIRGLRGTLPLHWDGTLGDPFGGPNGEVGVNGNVAPSCSLAGGEQACFRDLVDASLAGVMCTQPSCPPGPSGLPGPLTGQEREHLALYLQSVAYPPARSRTPGDVLTTAARNGFADFFVDQGGNTGADLNTCADTTGGCHALPLGTSTNSRAVGAFEAPTMRGMTDRFLQFSGGFTSPQEVLDAVAPFTGQGVIPWSPAQGLDERVVFSAGFPAFNPVYNVLPFDLFQMFEEASTGQSGAIGRQVSLNARTTAGALGATTAARMTALEDADERGVVNLRGYGLRDAGSGFAALRLSYKAPLDAYDAGAGLRLTPAQLRAEAQAGTTVVQLTAHLRARHGQPDSLQPLIATATTGTGATGDPPLPVLPAGNPMTLAGATVRADSRIFVDGQPVAGTLSCVGGSFAPVYCSSDRVSVQLAALPANGLRMLQLQNPAGPLSNELPICVGPVSGCR
ncbi:MAG TPA: cytochrome c peroxidase [Myxococcota bacterium]|nr:cytochrome c peroxidase [Myxococcota bacterium]